VEIVPVTRSTIRGSGIGPFSQNEQRQNPRRWIYIIIPLSHTAYTICWIHTTMVYTI